MKTRIFFSFLILFLIASCAHMEPPLRHEAATPGLLIDEEKPLSSSQAEREAITLEQATGQVKSHEDHMRLLEVRQQNFNKRLTETISVRHKAEAPGKAKPSAKRMVSAKQPVSFHFDDANLVEVVRLFMKLLQKDYILHPNVGGKVTMEVDENLNSEQLHDLLRGVLRIQGAAMVDNGSLLEIMPLSSVPLTLAENEIIIPGNGEPLRGQSIRAFRLGFLKAADLLKVIKPFLSKGAMVNAHEVSGIFMVCDYPHTLEKIARLVRLFDVSVFAGLHMKMYQLKYVDSEEMARELDELTKTVGLSPGNGKSPGSALSFLPMPRLNLLLAMARDVNAMEFADLWIDELDRDLALPIREEKSTGIFVYYVQNGTAAKIVDVLKGLFDAAEVGERSMIDKDEKKDEDGKRIVKLTSGLEKNTEKVSVPPEAVSGSLEKPVTFVVDETTNSILIRSSGSDYRKILPVIKKLDLFPKQVLIEATIAEVLLDESTKLGIEWQYLAKGLMGTDATGLVSVDSGLGTISGTGESLIGSGFSYLVANTDRFTALIKAFAGQNKLNVLSSPHIIASDNQVAKIDIGQEVPIVTSEYRTTDASSTATTVDKTIQYRDVGIILEVTPHINENGIVRMEISQEVSEISNTTVEGVNSPVFRKRVATTTLAVKDQQTIVIGGLIQQTNTNSQTGVPFLSRIPILKYLFGYEGKAFASTELMIFITPHVIMSDEDSAFVSKTFIKRLEKIKAQMVL